MDTDIDQTTTNDDDFEHKGNMLAKMFIHFGFGEMLVFNSWQPKTEGDFVGSCFAFVFIAMFSQFLSLLRRKSVQFLEDKEMQRMELGERESDSWTQSLKKYFSKMIGLKHIVQTIFEIIQIIVSFFLMVAVMTLNFWIILSVVIGLGIGYFLFSVETRKSNQRGFYSLCEYCPK